MTTTTARPASPADVLALQYVNPTRMVVVPLSIVLAVVVVMIAVSVVIARLGGDPAAADWNGALVWSITGYTIAIGVQVVATSFPLALALGTTRRTFVLGNLLTVGAQALLFTAAALVLLGLELATGGWFVGARVLADGSLGGGNGLLLALIMGLGSLTALSIGGVFGAAHVRFGARGPLLLSLGLVLVLAAGLLVLLPALIAAAVGFEPWWLVVAAVVLVVVSLGGQYAFLRRAAVR
jgi:hypothetical protein